MEVLFNSDYIRAQVYVNMWAREGYESPMSAGTWIFMLLIPVHIIMTYLC